VIHQVVVEQALQLEAPLEVLEVLMSASVALVQQDVAVEVDPGSSGDRTPERFFQFFKEVVGESGQGPWPKGGSLGIPHLALIWSFQNLS